MVGLPARRSFSRRGQLHTVRVAALEEPAVEMPLPSTSETSETEEKFGMDDTSAEVLYQRFKSLIDSGNFVFKAGDTVTGRVESVDQRGAYVELGSKSPGFCPVTECSTVRVYNAGNVLSPGDTREFLVLYNDSRRNQLVLSLKGLEEKVLWQRFRQMLEEKITFIGKVVEAIPVGCRVDVFGKSGFIPFSHLPYGSKQEELTGQEISLRFLELDEGRARIVCSARKPRNTLSIVSNLQVGDVVEGTVVTIQVYGAFVDLGNGLNGLLHVSQISHDRVSNVESLLKVGDRLKVMILTKDASMGRVSLSTKKLEPNPGDMLRDPQLVFERADEMAALFRANLQAVRNDVEAVAAPDAPVEAAEAQPL